VEDRIMECKKCKKEMKTVSLKQFKSTSWYEVTYQCLCGWKTKEDENIGSPRRYDFVSLSQPDG
jgi:hypothetical protein